MSAEFGDPEVSVVIPTRGGETLERAVQTALDQTGVRVEVLVVINSPLRSVEFDDERVRVLESSAEGRGNGARNLGISSARAPYVALLDDDDYWHPEKIRRQLDAIQAAGSRVVVGCALEERRPDGTGIRTSPRKPAPIGDVRTYLFRRTGLVSNLNQLQTSTLLVPTDLGSAAPFDAALRFHQDWSWLLAAEDAGASFIQLPEALAYREITGAESVGGRISWQQSADWAVSNISDDRLLGDFLLIMVLPKALRRGDADGAAEVFHMARHHRPSLSARLHARLTYSRWRLRNRSRRPAEEASRPRTRDAK